MNAYTSVSVCITSTSGSSILLSSILARSPSMRAISSSISFMQFSFWFKSERTGSSPGIDGPSSHEDEGPAAATRLEELDEASGMVLWLDEEAAELARGKGPLEVAAKPRDEEDEAPMALIRAEVTSESRCLQEETSTVDVSWAEEYLAIVAVPDDEDASDIAKWEDGTPSRRERLIERKKEECWCSQTQISVKSQFECPPTCAKSPVDNLRTLTVTRRRVEDLCFRASISKPSAAVHSIQLSMGAVFNS
ncbi:hypothetical protein NMY22_g8449 [Coprinellus aureogranulatus]|nr:hypothetical protein NMY22_g8449 [Coprinellus aureogranulatus]